MHASETHQEPKHEGLIDNLGIAVADLVENVIANSLKIAEDVANDAARVARSAGQLVRDLRDL